MGDCMSTNNNRPPPNPNNRNQTKENPANTKPVVQVPTEHLQNNHLPILDPKLPS